MIENTRTAPAERADHSLINEDLAPVAPGNRKWGTGNFAALWVSMSLCIPTYMMASSLIQGGMNWWQAVLTIFAGNVIVLIPMVLNGHAGAKYGISFPVLARVSFGIRGANIPALLRAIVACGWFGIQTWIGGAALYQLLRAWIPSLEAAGHAGLFPPLIPFLCFMAFWAVNVYVIYRGIESIKRLLIFKAWVLPFAALALLLWAFYVIEDAGIVLASDSQFESAGDFFAFFFPALTGIVGFWATLSLNIPDFTRYAVSQRAQVKGQMLGLPTSMAVFSFVGVFVTSVTVVIYGEAIWDPVALIGKFEDRVVVTFAMLAIVISTLATNIAANIVSPANDFANLAPSRISFRQGGYITAVIGVLIFPWKLIADPSGYIFTWLVGYSALLGPIGGIMIADYFFVRKMRIRVHALYRSEGEYTYRNGYNPAAIGALVLGVLPNLPGFLVTVHAVSPGVFPAWLTDLYHYAWFIGLFVSGALYLVWTRLSDSSN